MAFYFLRAIESGVTREGLIDMIAHLAFSIRSPSPVGATSPPSDASKGAPAASTVTSYEAAETRHPRTRPFSMVPEPPWRGFAESRRRCAMARRRRQSTKMVRALVVAGLPSVEQLMSWELELVRDRIESIVLAGQDRPSFTEQVRDGR